MSTTAGRLTFGSSETAGRARQAMARIRGNPFLTFFSAVVVVQGIHVVEHVIQLAQVYLFGVPEEEALGLLGYVWQIQGTEEWLHLGFNAVFLVALLGIAAGLVRLRGAIVPRWAVGAFLVLGVGLEAWHVVEHGVIISGVLANDGCPCPGILDARLGVSDTVLHFVYNGLAYAGTVIPFVYLWRRARSAALPAEAGSPSTPGVGILRRARSSV